MGQRGPALFPQEINTGSWVLASDIVSPVPLPAALPLFLAARNLDADVLLVIASTPKDRTRIEAAKIRSRYSARCGVFDKLYRHHISIALIGERITYENEGTVRVGPAIVHKRRICNGFF